MDRSPPSLIAVHLQNAERQRGGSAKLLTELLRGKNFWGGDDEVVRISEAVAQGVGCTGPGSRAADNRHRHRSSRPAGVSSFGNPSGERLTAIYVSLCTVVPRWFLATYRPSTASWPADSSSEFAMP